MIKYLIFLILDELYIQIMIKIRFFNIRKKINLKKNNLTYINLNNLII